MEAGAGDSALFSDVLVARICRAESFWDVGDLGNIGTATSLFCGCTVTTIGTRDNAVGAVVGVEIWTLAGD